MNYKNTYILNWAYLQRSEFNLKYPINNARMLPFKFVHTADNTTYVILTEEECYKFRNEMESIIKSCFIYILFQF